MAPEIPGAGGPAPKPGDIAAHQQAVEPGPNPAARAALGLVLGAATGLLVAALTTRRPDEGRWSTEARDGGR